jgi:ppGpp synthetase/RelA/SpoT-type nucleotidyltranferase
MQQCQNFKHGKMVVESPRYSAKRINRAGLLIRDAESRNKEVDEAFDLVGSWRSLHGPSLREAHSVLQHHAKEIDPRSLVSERLKRIPAMQSKLRRPKNRNMKLASMQDIAGCRAVVNSIEDVLQLASRYPVKRDYINQPNEDGYRSIHIVEQHERQKIEIQIRSRLQHVWASALETVDLLLDQKLKLGSGDPRWRRFSC